MAVTSRTYELVLSRLPAPPVDAFWRAICAGDLAVLQAEFARGLDNTMINVDLAASRAAANGQLAVLRFLKEQGVDIRARNDDAVWEAAKNGHLDVLRYLHEQGADIGRSAMPPYYSRRRAAIWTSCAIFMSRVWISGR